MGVRHVRVVTAPQPPTVMCVCVCVCVCMCVCVCVCVLGLTTGASDGRGAQAYPYVLRRVLQDRSPAMRQVRV